MGINKTGMENKEATAPEALFFDSHMHTPLCRHAFGEPEEYVAQGHSAGLRGIVFTCHSPMPDRFSHAVRMRPEEFETYVELIRRAGAAAPEGFEVRLGLESDWFPGMEAWLEDLHRRADFHYILGSVHWHIPEYLDAFYTGDLLAFHRGYFGHLAESAESGLFDCLSHPDLVKNATPSEWDFDLVKDEIARALDRIAATGVAMELNTSGRNKNFPEMNPGPEMLSMMAERGIPIVIGSDSHIPGRVSDGFTEALDLLERAGFREVNVFQHRRRQAFSIPAVRNSLIVPGWGTE